MKSFPRLTNRYRVMLNDADFTTKLKLSAAFNYFQEIAGAHAEKLGFGFSAMENIDTIWALTRMRVDIDKYPLWDETITIETWPRQPKKYEFFRDYLMRDEAGEIIARATSIWVLLDVQSKRLKRKDEVNITITEYVADRSIDCSLGKIQPPCNLEPVYKRLIGCSDIDMNGHLNNSKYLDFLMDCFNMEQLRTYQARSIQVNYLNETFPGDAISLSSCTIAADNQVYVEGIKDDGTQVFIARLEISAD
jgi:medium-chain acyl-[acyl-carrier-protein] hydrolase